MVHAQVVCGPRIESAWSPSASLLRFILRNADLKVADDLRDDLQPDVLQLACTEDETVSPDDRVVARSRKLNRERDLPAPLLEVARDTIFDI